MSTTFSYDVFLSYNHKDKERVRRLAEQLRAAGLSVWFDEWNVRAGEIIAFKIDQGLEHSRVLVLCISPNTLASNWADLERSTFIHRDPINEGRRFIPLLLADCELPYTLQRYKHIDFRDETDVAAFAELVTVCQIEVEERPAVKVTVNKSIHRTDRQIKSGLALFISYAHQDERFRNELRGALTPYERTGELEVWDDTCVVPGQQWEDEILAKLEKADIVVLLLSNDFIRSEYCFKREMQIARERDKTGKCAIIPIVVRACPYTRLELGQLQAIIPGGKPIIQHKFRDAAWLEVIKQLDKVIARFNQRERTQ